MSTAGFSDRQAASIERQSIVCLEELLRELKGERALAAMKPSASLERDLGLGSLERVELLSRLERHFQLRFPETALAETETVQDLAGLVLGGGSSEKASPALELDWTPTRLAPPSHARTLGDVLKRRAEVEPDRTHLVLREEGGAERNVTFGDLFTQALTVAGGLRALGVERHDTVALMLPTSEAFFQVFMGTLLAGAIPVPLYPPFRLNRIREFAGRQARILANAATKVFVTVEQARGVGTLLKKEVHALEHVVSVPDLLEASAVSPEESDASDGALIQYTSGSTGDPKGVLLTHENLLANIRAIGEVLGIEPTDIGVSWLPLYHDMGLIGAWLTPLYFGIPTTILSPLAFLTRPEQWLWTIHTRRATISPAPNFAYELCTRKIREEDVEGLDLSSWRCALNGGEPVSERTVARFLERFGRYGFRAGSMLPVYGLAESSLILSAPERDTAVRVEHIAREAFESEGLARARAEQEAHPLVCVSMGAAVTGHQIRIVDDDGRKLPERQVGHLEFRGPSAMQGYYRNEAASDSIRRPGGWLASGDRAFLADGELFITGREKDLIIRAGRNLVPQEIEELVSTVEGVRSGCVVAFGAPDPRAGSEKLVVVAEVRDTDDVSKGRIHTSIQATLTDLLGSPAEDVSLVPPRTIPKTSSGKLRRSAARELYLEGALGESAESSFLFLWRVTALALPGKVGRGLRRLGRFAYGLYAYALTAAFVPPMWGLAKIAPRRLLQRSLVGGSRLYLRLSGLRFELDDRVGLGERAGPFVFVANHASYLDPIPLMAALDIDYAFVIKDDAAAWPFVGTFIDKLGHLPVARFDARESAKASARMRELIEQGRSLVLFPEGTFSYAAGIRPFKMGAFKLAADTGLPVVPVALIGTRRWLRDGTWLPRRGPLKVVFAEPRVVGKSLPEMTRVREEVSELFSRLVAEPRLDLVAAGLEPPEA